MQSLSPKQWLVAFSHERLMWTVVLALVLHTTLIVIAPFPFSAIKSTDSPAIVVTLVDAAAKSFSSQPNRQPLTTLAPQQNDAAPALSKQTASLTPVNNDKPPTAASPVPQSAASLTSPAKKPLAHKRGVSDKKPKRTDKSKPSFSEPGEPAKPGLPDLTTRQTQSAPSSASPATPVPDGVLVDGQDAVDNMAVASHATNPAQRQASSPDPALAPVALYAPEPEFPEEARWENRTGKTTLAFRLAAGGSVADVKILHSSGHGDLDASAIEALRSWRFAEPVQYSVNTWYQYLFRFDIL